MKKIYKFLFLLTPLSGLTPLFLSSCSQSSVNVLREFDLNSASSNRVKTINDVKPSSTSVYDLIKGGKKIHHGNYIILLASQMSKETNKWLSSSGDSDLSYFDYFNTERSSVFNPEIITALDKAAIKYNQGNGLDFGIYLMMDVEPSSIYEQWPTSPLRNYYPFDYKWTDADITDIGKMGDDYKEQYKNSVNKYARTDDYAVQMRDFVDYMNTLFTSSKFGVKDASGLPYAMVWKDGIPQTKDHFHKIDLERNDKDNNLKTYIDFLDENKKDK